ncbi:MAG: hypothetical protein KGH84_04515 [Paracoccaceae bacterium]|nr:hypothetical protein [Paracoccaceae bacterium]
MKLPLALSAALALALAASLAGPAMAQTTLTAAEKSAALAALDDEYQAFATYQAVMEKIGAQRPFSNIIRAEQRHIDLVAAVLKDAGEPIPANPYLDGTKPRPVAPATRAEACKVGVQAEMANAGLYDGKLLPQVKGNARLTQVFVALRDASQNNHLPAFQRCAG